MILENGIDRCKPSILLKHAPFGLDVARSGILPRFQATLTGLVFSPVHHPRVNKDTIMAETVETFWFILQRGWHLGTSHAARHDT
jgi:hypothetical protein